MAKGVFISVFLIIGSFVWSGYNFSMVLLVTAWCSLSERSWLSLQNSYDRTIFPTFALQLSKMHGFCPEIRQFSRSAVLVVLRKLYEFPGGNLVDGLPPV